MKTQLFHALSEADYTTLDHYEVDKVIFNEQSRVTILECPVDDGDVTFADQEIDVVDGDAVAYDVTGEKRVLTFVAKVPWAPTEKVTVTVDEQQLMRDAVLQAMQHVRRYWPEVTKVIYDEEGRWRYVDGEWNLVRWENPKGGRITKDQTAAMVAELEVARDRVDNAIGFPAMFELSALEFKG